MPLQFWNTLTRKKEIYEPIDKGSEDHKPLVRIYTCGPTVYDYAHIGNLRTYAFEDLLCRYLRWKGNDVKQVMNITDIDDKTIRGCQQQGVSLSEYTSKYTEAFREDLRCLNIESAEYYPRATEHINEMVEIIQKLLSLGAAYRGDDGSIYYDISKFSQYGKLAHIDMTGLRPGARVSHDEYDKENLSDFALWKAWDEKDGPVFWKTSLGKGRPGWHIECSAMSMKYLGETFDIHCGGVDNIFPHHQNEIAQSEAYSGKKFVNYWLHSEHLIVDNKKMSKSLGNFYTLRDLIEKVDFIPKDDIPMALRYLYISSHYRSRLNFTLETLKAAHEARKRLKQFYILVMEKADFASIGNELLISDICNNFNEAMDDDLNSPEAFGILLSAVRTWNSSIQDGSLTQEYATSIWKWLERLDNNLLGLQLHPKRAGMITTVTTTQTLTAKAAIKKTTQQTLTGVAFIFNPTEKIQERQKAKEAKDYKRADEIREELLKEHGVVVEDTPSGTRWKMIGRVK